MEEIKKTTKAQKLFSELFLFRGTAPETAARIFRSPACICCRFETGEAIYTRTSYRRSLGVVLSGGLKAVKAPEKTQPVVMNTFSTGNVFGAASLFDSEDRYVSDIFAVRQSNVLFLSQELLHRLFTEEPAAAENYIAFLSGRIRYLNACIDHYTGGSAQERLFSYLSSLPENPSGEVEILCSMTCLADSLDIGRASLYRAFESLRKDGILERRGKKLILHPSRNADDPKDRPKR